MEDWFEWNGIKCTSYGIHIIEQPSIIRAPERVTYTNIPGRSGALTTLEGDAVYDDFILPVECTVQNMTRLQEICSWLKGAGTLTLAAHSGGFFYARISNQIEFSKVLRNHENRTFSLAFRCKPFWYAKNVPDITLTSSGSFITNPGSVFAEPVITVYGSGDVTLMVGMSITELSGISSSITLDTPLMEAYSGATSLNNRMSGEFPTLLPGNNAVSWTGNVSRLVIQPNWRYL